MVGDQVGGYVIREIVGSGQALLYLALHAESNHVALVQRWYERSDVESFKRHARELFGVVPFRVERRLTRAGVAVLFAMRDEASAESGHTEFTNTERVSGLAQPSPAPSRLVPALIVIGSLLAGLLIAWLFTR